MEEIIKTQKSYKKLGFTYLETAEIVITLNQLLSNYIIHYHKLRSFHWNVEGGDFFELHEQFEIEYNEVKSQTDTIAERIRVFGLKPKSTLKEYLKLSRITEIEGELTPIAMVKEILKDFQILHDSILDVMNAALEAGDSATEEMATEFIRRLEKRHWMFTSWSKC
ncbi:Dps family protein [Aquimarina muelleri]|uniref:DNA starvation/stationary phase protection protein n=1 Tax=Aquimarina muelleri TaxID=279356 RepID=A0A918N4W6_9FLAO|nr:DNA starvation/stationary phase protection protein [Aquimarina muelleri]MCX2764734.1 DNA starvation/stationary phase protection protein [Aquimarina muelleri]GGX33443.1 DNA starvation/stationary phase protection protein [Aquimarina muelleri]